MQSGKPTFFATPADLRAWLDQHHASESELWVGFYKKASGTPSITWPESVDEALCVGWIDGIRKSLDYERYMIRFTPRKPKSNWSTVNINRVAELTKEGRMKPEGLKAFEERVAKRDYAYEADRPAEFSPELAKQFRATKKAWAFFEAQAPYYRRTLTYWVMSAKKDETRIARLEKLIAASAAGKRVT